MKDSIFFGIILIITVIVIWKCYWRIQIMYNSSALSLYTPDNTFPISNKNTYEKMTNLGEKVVRNRTIVICSLLRDVKNRLPEIEKRAEKLGNIFKDYRILIVENDSSDGTREELLRWTKRNPKVVILGCGYNVKKCSIKSAKKRTAGHSVYRSRIEKMTKLRNIYLNEVKRNYDHFDYMAVWDLDIIGTVYLDGVMNSMGWFEKRQKLDAICAYGIYRWGTVKLYYDTYAHIEKNDKFHINLKTIHDLKKGLGTQYQRGDFPQEVVSCFSGFTIYRISSLLNPSVIYDMSPPDNLECEHVRLNRKLRNMVMNPSMIHFVLLND